MHCVHLHFPFYNANLSETHNDNFVFEPVLKSKDLRKYKSKLLYCVMDVL